MTKDYAFGIYYNRINLVTGFKHFMKEGILTLLSAFVTQVDILRRIYKIKYRR